MLFYIALGSLLRAAIVCGIACSRGCIADSLSHAPEALACGRGLASEDSQGS